MRGSLTATARVEIDDILARIGRDNPTAATEVGAAIKAAIGRLGFFPRIGTRTEQSGIYVEVVRPYRYLVFYRIDGDNVIVRNVRHASRQPPSINTA